MHKTTTAAAKSTKAHTNSRRAIDSHQSGLSDPAMAIDDSQGFHYHPLHGQPEGSGANESHCDGLRIWE